MLVAAAVLGTIVGSFLNALLFRYRTGLSVMHGRSQCMRCGHPLAARDLVPILSYLVAGGRCRYCGVRLSVQYSLVEVAGGLIAAGTYLLYPEPTQFAYWLAVHFVLLFIVVYDLRHKIIPHAASLTLFVLALGHVWYTGFDVWTVAGALLALPLFLFAAVSRGRWMGWGDAPLQLSLGLLLGLSAGLTALFIAFWVGALVGIGLVVLSKGYRMSSEVPFAPFLIAGAWVAHFFHVDFFPLLPYLFS